MNRFALQYFEKLFNVGVNINKSSSLLIILLCCHVVTALRHYACTIEKVLSLSRRLGSMRILAKKNCHTALCMALITSSSWCQDAFVLTLGSEGQIESFFLSIQLFFVGSFNQSQRLGNLQEAFVLENF